MAEESAYRRINVTILEEQYRSLSDQGINFSGLIRDLLGDYLSESVVTLQVSDETRRLYDLVVSNTGSTDKELEEHLRSALAQMLDRKITDMQKLREKLADESD